MKKAWFSLLAIIAVYAAAHAQVIQIKGMDSNPRLNEAESAYLQPLFPSAIFSFHDKHTGFKYLAVDTARANAYSLYHVTKQHYFTRYDNGQHTYAYRLFILDKAARKKTSGYEAVIVFTEKRFEAMLQRISSKEVAAFFRLDYPEIPDDAGSDNSPVLNASNAAFFHALYKRQVPASFDFSGKKIAILDTRDDTANPQPVIIGAYVAKVREDLLLHEHFYPDYIYVLNEEQKKRSGGYDVVIRYRSKEPVALEKLLQFLGKTEAGQ